MNVIRTKGFDQSFGKLPREAKRLYLAQEQRFKENWKDPRLHVKKLHNFEHALSFRVTRNWRVLFYFQNKTAVIFFEIDNRKDIYR